MGRQVIGLVLILTALASLARGDDKASPEDEKLYGTWKMTALEVMGELQPIPDDPFTFTFAKGGKVSSKKSNDAPVENIYKLGATKPIREIDLITPAKDGKKEETIKAIYQIDGDTLKLVFSLRGPREERPTALDSSKATLVTFKRQKP